MQQTKYRILDFLGYPKYRVGDDGSVWTRKIPGHREGFAKDWRQMKSVSDFNGYQVIMLRGDREAKILKVHRLVLLAFIGECPKGMQACHNDGNPANNHVSNLRWDTNKNNQRDRIKHNTDNRGERCKRAKLTEEKVLEIRRLWGTGEWSQIELGNRFGVTNVNIRYIIDRRTWKHI